MLRLCMRPRKLNTNERIKSDRTRSDINFSLLKIYQYTATSQPSSIGIIIINIIIIFWSCQMNQSWFVTIFWSCQMNQSWFVTIFWSCQMDQLWFVTIFWSGVRWISHGLLRSSDLVRWISHGLLRSSDLVRWISHGLLRSSDLVSDESVMVCYDLLILSDGSVMVCYDLLILSDGSVMVCYDLLILSDGSSHGFLWSGIWSWSEGIPVTGLNCFKSWMENLMFKPVVPSPFLFEGPFWSFYGRHWGPQGYVTIFCILLRSSPSCLLSSFPSHSTSWRGSGERYVSSPEGSGAEK